MPQTVFAEWVSARAETYACSAAGESRDGSNRPPGISARRTGETLRMRIARVSSLSPFTSIMNVSYVRSSSSNGLRRVDLGATPARWSRANRCTMQL